MSYPHESLDRSVEEGLPPRGGFNLFEQASLALLLPCMCPCNALLAPGIPMAGTPPSAPHQPCHLFIR